MIGYLYQITNKINGKKYIGKTNNLNRRIERHYLDLKNNKHHSQKLQRAFNKYGKENFVLTYETFSDISEEQLANKEIKAIQQYDSYYNGYNETLGGQGHSVLFDFNTTVLIFQIGKRYDGVKRLLGRYFNCDHSTITDIMKREELDLVEYNETDLQNLIQKVGISEENLKQNYKNNYLRKLTEQQVLKILALVEIGGYSQAAVGRVYGVERDVVQKIFAGKTYKKDKMIYDALTKQQKEKIFQNTKNEIIENKLEESKKMSKIKINQQIVDFIMNHKDIMTQQDIGKKLGIDRKRVGRIINKETYKDLVQNWEERHALI